ncbi:MAG: hypothetical protein MSG64_15655 [Pyrinomonadaceae bacterium MAG19_C2-C3]|nr:hypothetical protein [Pyrinomonadaceae bacterium MAG19_C2-C3]
MKKNNSTAAEIAAVFGDETATVEIDGKPHVMRPLRLRQFSNILTHIDALVAVGTIRIESLEDAKEFTEKFDPVKMILRGGDPVMNILQVASALPRQTLDNLDLATAAKLLKALWDINADYFQKKLMPEIETTFGGLTMEGLKTAVSGLTESVSSSAAGITSQTSETTPITSS